MRERLPSRWWVVENIGIVPLAVIVASVAAYWALVIDRLPPIELSEGRIVPAVARPGEVIHPIWSLKVLRKQPCSGAFTRYVVDGRRKVHYEAQQIIRDKIYADEPALTRPFNLSYDAQWGEDGSASYHIEGSFRCSGLSLTRLFPIHVSWPALPFRIVAP